MQSPIRAASSARSLPLEGRRQPIRLNARSAQYIEISMAKSQQAAVTGTPDTCRRSLPACRQRLEPAQDESRTPFRVLGIVQPKFWQPAEQRGDGDFGLDPRQLGTEAEM